MGKPYFIMLWLQNGEGGMPIVDENDNVMFYASEKEAQDDMKDHSYAQAYGFAIFEMGTGVSG